MTGGLIIGGNWATTEPFCRKPEYRPSQNKLFILTNVELDTLDALSMLGRASSVNEIYALLAFGYCDKELIRKTLSRLCALKCATRFPIKSGRGGPQYRYEITNYGADALYSCLDMLIERMNKRGDGGIRSER